MLVDCFNTIDTDMHFSDNVTNCFSSVIKDYLLDSCDIHWSDSYLMNVTMLFISYQVSTFTKLLTPFIQYCPRQCPFSKLLKISRSPSREIWLCTAHSCSTSNSIFLMRSSILTLTGDYISKKDSVRFCKFVQSFGYFPVENIQNLAETCKAFFAGT